MDAPSIRKVTPADIAILARRLAPSFASQPLTRWLLGKDPTAMDKGERVLELDFLNAIRYGLTYTTEDFRGAALWNPPDRSVSAWENITWFLKLLRIAGVSLNLPAQLAAFWRFERLFPDTPNYYLSLLAVGPDAQGKGFGSALLGPVLAMCDTQGVMAYTVTDWEPNLRFYGKMGFRVRDIIPIPKAGVTAWTLSREPGARNPG